jgi:hypothetical protein
VAALGVALAVGGAWHAVLILVLLAAVLWAGEVAGALSRAAGAVRDRVRQRRELDLRRDLLQVQTELAFRGQARPAAAACAHAQAVPVPDIGGNIVAWLCPQCDVQLPAEFSVQEGR